MREEQRDPYQTELDPARRLALLEEGLKSGGEPELWARRKLYFDRRYRFDRKENKYFDRFLAAFLELLVENRRGPKKIGFFAKKQIREALETLGAGTEDAEEEEFLFNEYCHLAKVYEDLSRNSREYGSLLMGIGSLKPEQVRDKIRGDFHEVARELPEKAGLVEEMSLLSEALLQAAADLRV